MKSILLICAVLTAIFTTVTYAYTPDYSQSVTGLRGTAYSKFLNRFDGMVETSYNRGEFIDKANTRYAYQRAPYCASGQSLAMDLYNAQVPQGEASLKLVFPVRSARAKDFIQPNSIDARDVYFGKLQPPDFCFLVYTRTGGGHVAYRARDVGGRSHNFHFNATPTGNRGSAWNGVWSGWKNENLKSLCSPLNAFRIIKLTRIC